MKKGLFLFLIMAFAVFGSQNWSFESLVLNIPAEDDFVYDGLIFGINEYSTPLFDSLDQAHPPCPPSGPCAYIVSEDPLVGMLRYDFRPFASEGDTLVWEVVVTGTSEGGVFNWNTAAVPMQGEFWAAVSYPSVEPSAFVAMETESSLEFLPAQQLTIKWVWNSEKVAEKKPTELLLNDNRPNPFNAATEISFSLPEDGFAELAIFDILGNQVNTLLSGEADAGSHILTWDGTDSRGNTVSTGVYFYRLTTQNESIAKRMYLLK